VTGTGRALVTGGAGFVGSHLCEALLCDGWEVVCLDNLCTGRTGNIDHLRGRPGFSFVDHDVTEPFPSLGTFRWVFALASAASPLHYHRLPVETLRAGARGTEHALQVARHSGGRFVLASTSEVYGDPELNPQPESYWGRVNPVGPRSVYDEAKRFAEALTAAYGRSLGVDTAIARIFNTFGPRMRADDGRMVPAFIRQALAGEPITITGSGDQTRSLCYVSDTVAGLIALARSTETGPINLGNPVELTVTELARLIRGLAGSSSELVHVPAVVDDPQRRCPDITLAGRRLGWRPEVTLEDGLRRTIRDLSAASDEAALVVEETLPV
jgi:dTDP-glucose 4,6-dehydratase